MLILHLNDLIDADVPELARRIRAAGDRLEVTITAADQYQSDSVWTLAGNWLRAWYIAESLAGHASRAACDFQEGDRGTGEFAIAFSGVTAALMAERLVELAAVFDPEELECGALIYDEAEEWLKQREDKPAIFPELEEAYHDELAAAREHDEQFGANDDEV